LTENALHRAVPSNNVEFMQTKSETTRPGVFEAVKAEADQNWVFGLEYQGKLSADAHAQLYDLVILRGGTLHTDNWITLPRRSAVPGLIDAAAEIGVHLAASVRRR
jgi:hypothetical protein